MVERISREILQCAVPVVGLRIDGESNGPDGRVTIDDSSRNSVHPIHHSAIGLRE